MHETRFIVEHLGFDDKMEFQGQVTFHITGRKILVHGLVPRTARDFWFMAQVNEMLHGVIRQAMPRVFIRLEANEIVTVRPTKGQDEEHPTMKTWRNLSADTMTKFGVKLIHILACIKVLRYIGESSQQFRLRRRVQVIQDAREEPGDIIMMRLDGKDAFVAKSLGDARGSPFPDISVAEHDPKETRQDRKENKSNYRETFDGIFARQFGILRRAYTTRAEKRPKASTRRDTVVCKTDGFDRVIVRGHVEYPRESGKQGDRKENADQEVHVENQRE